jgi:hypothetical protein
MNQPPTMDSFLKRFEELPTEKAIEQLNLLYSMRAYRSETKVRDKLLQLMAKSDTLVNINGVFDSLIDTGYHDKPAASITLWQNLLTALYEARCKARGIDNPEPFNLTWNEEKGRSNRFYCNRPKPLDGEPESEQLFRGENGCINYLDYRFKKINQRFQIEDIYQSYLKLTGRIEQNEPYEKAYRHARELVKEFDYWTPAALHIRDTQRQLAPELTFLETPVLKVLTVMYAEAITAARIGDTEFICAVSHAGKQAGFNLPERKGDVSKAINLLCYLGLFGKVGVKPLRGGYSATLYTAAVDASITEIERRHEAIKSIENYRGFKSFCQGIAADAELIAKSHDSGATHARARERITAAR